MAELKRDELAEMAALSCCDLGCADDPDCACEGCDPEPARISLWERIKKAFGWTW